jgi:hypothetical protein
MPTLNGYYFAMMDIEKNGLASARIGGVSTLNWKFTFCRVLYVDTLYPEFNNYSFFKNNLTAEAIKINTSNNFKNRADTKAMRDVPIKAPIIDPIPIGMTRCVMSSLFEYAPFDACFVIPIIIVGKLINRLAVPALYPLQKPVTT